jgi:hypothetical protein
MLAVRDYIRIRIGVHYVNRDLELRIKGHLYEIAAVNDDVLESRQGFPAAEHGYLKTLTSVADCADDKLVDQVAELIKEHIRTREERPTNRSVRQDARTLLAEEEIAADTYLNQA